MGRDALTPEEIQALFAAAGEPRADQPAAPAEGAHEPALAAVQQLLESGQEVLSALAGRPITFGPAARAASPLPGGPAALVEAEFVQGVLGWLWFIMPNGLAVAMSQMLLGDGGTEEGSAGEGAPVESPLSDLALSALAEAFSQALGAGATRLGQTSGVSVLFGPVESRAVATAENLSLDPEATWLSSLVTAGEASGPIWIGLDPSLLEGLERIVAPKTAPVRKSSPPSPPRAARPEESGAAPRRAPAAPPPSALAVEPSVAVRPAAFEDFGEPSEPAGSSNIDLLLDVPLQVTVELGRARRQIRDVLALGPGSVLELDKLAGESVDVLVNGRLIARGEVVVIDENFGVRITDIVSPAERVRSLR